MNIMKGRVKTQTEVGLVSDLVTNSGTYNNLNQEWLYRITNLPRLAIKYALLRLAMVMSRNMIIIHGINLDSKIDGPTPNWIAGNSI